MSYDTKQLVTESAGKPVPQYYNSVSDQYEVLQGANGASRVLLYDVSGNPLLTAANPGVVCISKIQRVLAFSTTALLAANAVYTSPTIDALNYCFLTGFVYSNSGGTISIQQCDDGVTWRQCYAPTYTGGSPALAIPKSDIKSTLSARYVRWVYTNGATAQTSFELSAYLVAL